MKTVNLEQALRTLAREANSLTTEALKPFGITPLQYDILETISSHMEDPGTRAFGPIRISERVKLSSLHVGDETRYLSKGGYVRTSPGGHRVLTAKGIEFLEECRYALQGVNRNMQAYFDDYGLEAVAEAFLKQQEGAK